jgi:hypothetical protein
VLMVVFSSTTQSGDANGPVRRCPRRLASRGEWNRCEVCCEGWQGQRRYENAESR